MNLLPPNASKSLLEMQSRMAAILLSPANQTCADCPATNPEWVSFILERRNRTLAVFCCSQCAQHHHFELGEKRCHIKYLKMTHEWDPEDIETLENSGNAFVNAIYEANLADFDKSSVLPCQEEESNRRAKFIKSKYKKRKFRKAQSFDVVQRSSSFTAPAGVLAEMISRDKAPVKRCLSVGSLRRTTSSSGKQKRLTVVHSPRRDMRDRRLSKFSAAGMFITLASENPRQIHAA